MELDNPISILVGCMFVSDAKTTLIPSPIFFYKNLSNACIGPARGSKSDMFLARNTEKLLPLRSNHGLRCLGKEKKIIFLKKL